MDCLADVGRHRDAAARRDLRHQLDHALLDDRGLAGGDLGELGLVDIHARDPVAVAGEAGERYRADVAQAEDADVHRSSQ